MYKRFGLSTFAALGLTAAMAAQADTQPGFYAGVGIGEATMKVEVPGFDDFDASDTAFKIFGGYTFNQYFAVELSYFDGGAPNESFGSGSVEVELTGLNASAVGRLPLADTFALFGKIGFASYDVEGTGRVGNQTVGTFEGSDEDVSYGIGAAFSFAQTFEIRAEYEAIDFSGGDFNVLSLSGLYRF